MKFINVPPWRLSRLSAPSTVALTFVPEAPPKETFPTLCLVRSIGAIGVAPGSSSSIPLMLRVIIGRFWSSVVSMVDANFDCVTSISGAWPVTVSVSSTPARASLKSSVIVALIANVTRLRVAGANPASSVLTS